MTNPRSTYQWQQLSRQLRAQAKALDTPCGICGQPFNWELPSNNRWGATVDHKDPLTHGGELLPTQDRLQVVHRRCNSLAGIRARETNKRTNIIQLPNTKAGSSEPITPTHRIGVGTISNPFSLPRLLTPLPVGA